MTKKAKLIKLMRKQWVSPQIALEKCGLMSLAQRVSEMRKEREGLDTWYKFLGIYPPNEPAYPKVIDRWETKNGSRFKSYKIVG